MNSLEWIEKTHDLTTVENVRIYLETLCSLMTTDAEETKGRERVRMLGQASGIEMVLVALQNVK